MNKSYYKKSEDNLQLYNYNLKISVENTKLLGFNGKYLMRMKILINEEREL